MRTRVLVTSDSTQCSGKLSGRATVLRQWIASARAKGIALYGGRAFDSPPLRHICHALLTQSNWRNEP